MTPSQGCTCSGNVVVRRLSGAVISSRGKAGHGFGEADTFRTPSSACAALPAGRTTRDAGVPLWRRASTVVVPSVAATPGKPCR